MDLVSLISTLISWVLIGTIFFGRHWITARIQKSVQHGFDEKIESLRAELRKSEEQLKSELREKENEISALRTTVLSGSASRQSLLDKRRFEAVEKVWTAVNDLAQLKYLSGMMAVLNFKAIAKEANDPRMQQVLSVIGSGAPDLAKVKNVARDERLFLPELAWAYFAAYTTILYGSLARLSILKTGLPEADKYLTNDGTRKILKAALPHQSKFIDENEPEAYHYLLEEIEGYLLAELRKILEGDDADKAAAVRAKAIMDAIKHADEEKVENKVKSIM